MASSLPYAAPYTKTVAPQARPAPAVRINGQVLRFGAVVLAIVLLYTIIQLSLASVASATLHDLVRLESEIQLAEVERDVLLSRVEELRSPAKIEQWAIANGFRQLTDVEFLR